MQTARRLPRPQIFCTFRKFSDVQKRSAAVLGGNGYSLAAFSGTLGGGANPYIYPDNLPRVNARALSGDGHRGIHRPELGQPLFVDHVWGRQLGAYTINP